MEEFSESSANLDGVDRLREAFATHGYLFFRRLVDPSAVLAVRDDLTRVLAEIGWLANDRDPMDAIPSAKATREEANVDPEFLVAYEAIQRVERFHELAHTERIVKPIRDLLAAEVLVHPRKIARAALPTDYGYETPPHQDYRLIQGTVDVITVWMPLGDCPDTMGGLAVLEGSHLDGLHNVQPSTAVGAVAVDPTVSPSNPNWRSTDYCAGDVLMFHSYTVHAAKPNRSDRLRLSADYRYQSLTEPIVQGSLDPHFYPRIPGWDDLTRGWRSTWSIEHPAGLRLADVINPFTPDVPTYPSRLFSLSP